MSEIKITIDKQTGKMDIDAIGYQGIGCSHDLNTLLRQIGGKTIKTTRKKEYSKLKRTLRISR